MGQCNNIKHAPHNGLAHQTLITDDLRVPESFARSMNLSICRIQIQIKIEFVVRQDKRRVSLPSLSDSMIL